MHVRKLGEMEATGLTSSGVDKTLKISEDSDDRASSLGFVRFWGGSVGREGGWA